MFLIDAIWPLLIYECCNTFSWKRTRLGMSWDPQVGDVSPSQSSEGQLCRNPEKETYLARSSRLSRPHYPSHWFSVSCQSSWVFPFSFSCHPNSPTKTRMSPFSPSLNYMKMERFRRSCFSVTLISTQTCTSEKTQVKEAGCEVVWTEGSHLCKRLQPRNGGRKLAQLLW